MAQHCRACWQPLGRDGGAVLMDRAGHSYHIPCWYKEMEAEAEERRDQKPARTPRGPPRSGRDCLTCAPGRPLPGPARGQ